MIWQKQYNTSRDYQQRLNQQQNQMLALSSFDDKQHGPEHFIKLINIYKPDTYLLKQFFNARLTYATDQNRPDLYATWLELGALKDIELINIALFKSLSIGNLKRAQHWIALGADKENPRNMEAFINVVMEKSPPGWVRYCLDNGIELDTRLLNEGLKTSAEDNQLSMAKRLIMQGAEPRSAILKQGLRESVKNDKPADAKEWLLMVLIGTQT